MRSSLLWLIIIATPFLCARAQVAAPQGDAVPEAPGSLPYQLRFTVFAPVEALAAAFAAERFVLVADERESPVFAVPQNGFSAPVGASSRSLILASRLPDGSLHPVTPVVLPEHGHAFLVLLLPVEGRQGSFRSVVIRADDPAFPRGGIQLFNLSDARVGLKMQEQRVLLQPVSHQMIAPPKVAEGASSYQVEFYSQTDEGIRLFASTQWVSQMRVRTYVFIYRSPESGRMTYRAIDEFPSWVTRASAP